jgi:hypothetical protein
MDFTHPLAKKAKVWMSKASDGSEQRILVIITTIALDPDRERYKQKLVDRLSDAARDYLARSDEAEGFILMNRMKEWKTST